VLAFAAIYVAIAADSDCGMQIGSFMDAYYFSLETMVRARRSGRDCWVDGWAETAQTDRQSLW
jgi:hypothetical protein